MKIFKDIRTKRKSGIYVFIFLPVTVLIVFLLVSRSLIVADKDDITVVAYYFPNYHEDQRNSAYHGKGWTEWELLKAARPRFENHQQPKVPAWGYTDEADPKDMEVKIEAAADHDIDVFLFDWYMYEDGPFLNRALDEGFLGASNNDRLQFALMWANHDWLDNHPFTPGTKPKLLYPGKVSPQRYEAICDHVIQDYFLKNNYWKIEGKPYFSIYDIQKFVENFGSLRATRQAMDLMRQKAKDAGLKGVHWNLVAWGNPILPSEKTPADFVELSEKLGFNSVTSYVWVHHSVLPETQTDFNWVRDHYFEYWEEARNKFKVPYYPNVTMGWDPSPRCSPETEWANVGYPCMNTIGNNTPENFKKALKMTKRKLLEEPGGPRILNINCWNEWTEGSYLEPDTINGMKYLEAIGNVFD